MLESRSPKPVSVSVRLAPLALLFRRFLLRCRLFLWLGFCLGLRLGFFLGSRFRRLLGGRFRSRRPGYGSGRCLWLFFANDQLFFLGLYHFAAEFVVLLQP